MTEKQDDVPGKVRQLVGLKDRVSQILHEALRGYDLSERYRMPEGYIRWGLVEKDIHAAIDEEANATGEVERGGASDNLDLLVGETQENHDD